MYRMLALSVGVLTDLFLGKLEESELDDCIPARKLRWMAWRGEREDKRRRQLCVQRFTKQGPRPTIKLPKSR